MPFELGQEFIGPHNGTCGQLRKETHVEPEVGKALGRLRIATFEVNQIAYGLKGKESKSYGVQQAFYGGGGIVERESAGNILDGGKSAAPKGVT